MVIDSRRATGSIAGITNGRVVLSMGLNNGPHKDTTTSPSRANYVLVSLPASSSKKCEESSIGTLRDDQTDPSMGLNIRKQ